MKQGHRRKECFLRWCLVPIYFLMLGGDGRAQGPLGSSQHYLQGGTPVPAGQLEAVGRLSSSVGGCTATLISDRLVLTAAHCVCPEQAAPTGCGTRATFIFEDVRPVDDPTTGIDESASRRNVAVQGDVSVHPKFGAGGWFNNDFALLRLDRPASELVVGVSPIPVERPNNKPKAGDMLTLVGFGLTGKNCLSPSAGKQKLTLAVSNLTTGNVTIVFNKPGFHSCRGDSGGPALNAAGHIVGLPIRLVPAQFRAL